MGKRDGYAMVGEDDPQFCRFWNAYPKRVAKKDARKAWAQVRPNAWHVDQMIAALKWQTQQPAWIKDGGQYIPFPAKWLRAYRWEDEQPVIQQPQISQAVSGPVSAWLSQKAVG